MEIIESCGDNRDVTAPQTDGNRCARRPLGEIATSRDQGGHAARTAGNQHHLRFQAMLSKQLQVLGRPQGPLKTGVTVIADHHAFLSRDARGSARARTRNAMATIAINLHVCMARTGHGARSLTASEILRVRS